MRKIAFIKHSLTTQKLMIYKSNLDVYIFGYDCVDDTSANWDNWYGSVAEAEEFCNDEYEISINDWIEITDPIEGCQHDFILPTKRQNKIDQFEFYLNGKWIEKFAIEKHNNFAGLTGNERLFISGLITEYNKAEEEDKNRASKILAALGVG